MEIERWQVEALRRDAGEAGDLEMVAICDRALLGDREAWGLCEDVIEDAACQCDEVEDTDG